MTRQYFTDSSVEPPLADLSAITGTSETALWDPSLYTTIFPGEARPGKIWQVTAGGIMSFASTGTLTITPRFGLTTSGTTMGASIAQTTPGATTNTPWQLVFTCVCRSVGAAGVNSTVIGTGYFMTDGLGSAGTSVAITFGGTQATVDVSILAGICIGWTLSVAGTVTPRYAFIQTMN